MAKFNRPTELLLAKNTFSATEVGLTHQRTSAYVRLTDAGDVEIMADDGLGIILHSANKSVTIIADSLKILTKEDGFRWNDVQFNSNGTQWMEPALLKTEVQDMNGIFNGVEDFTKES